jgi:hemoglobin-like flavoprotein
MALMRVIGAAVERLDRPDDLLPAVEELGRRHVGYGVRVGHYAVVGEALLDALGEVLGAAAFTAEAEDAWRAAYGLLATTMQAGARAAAAAAAAGGPGLRDAA